MKRSAFLPFLAVCCTVPALSISGCAVPLAPQYGIAKQTEEIRFVASPEPLIQIRNSYTLINNGTTPLDYIDVGLPNQKAYGRRDLHVTLDGRDVQVTNLPEEYQFSAPDARRILMGSPWPRKDKHEIAIEYSFSSPELSGPRIGIAPGSFHLGAHGWQPALLPPHHVLADNPVRPPKSQYTVTVPADFLVLARGTQSQRKQNGADVTYRFHLRPQDLNVYVVAGRYVESASDGKSSVAFWTVRPLTENPAPAEQQIAAAYQILQKTFGSLDKNIRTVHILEAPSVRGDAPGATQGTSGAAAAVTFPGGALVNPAELALGVNSGEFLDDSTEAFAQSWFSDQIYPAANAVIGIGWGLSGYASIVIDEQRGGTDARRKRIQEFLRSYDEGVKGLAGKQIDGKPMLEESIIVTSPADPFEQRRISLAKAPLFYAALEDACGEQNVHAGIAHVVRTLRGQEVSFDALRSALEQSSGKNLAEMFRAWLYNPGMPKDFHERYSAGTSQTQ